VRSWATTIGLAALAIGAVWVAKTMVQPTKEKVERKQAVLNSEASARVTECRILEDYELPRGLERPGVGDDTMYILVTVHYPGYPEAPELMQHHLIRVDGREGARLEPSHAVSETDEDGSYAVLTFRTTQDFTFATLRPGEKVLTGSLRLE